MPNGPLAVLPLGAAGRGGRSALDHVVSSTVATIQSLGHVRRGERPTEPETLVVAVPRTRARPDIPDLTAVESEASDVVATVSSGHLVVGAEATVPAVGQLLPRYTDAHFACHAVADLDDPSRSGLLLADETLTVRAIRAVEMPRAGLAYLSACSTEFGSGTLLDEAIPVASAFQIAGYRDVVATMWPVGDLAARRLARLTYAAINDGADAAEAVHRTVVQTRRMLPDRPTVWAAHVHIGG
jgi:CHAT domain-containing protein